MAPGAADTPLLEVDIAAVERNIARMQRYCDGHGLRLWAHSKTHKLPQIAARQIAAGAAGVVCQKLGEAEVMAGEADDILITFPLVGEVKWRRLAALARRVRVTVIADSDLVARGLSQTLAQDGATVDLLVDCDTGFGRTGVQSVAAAVQLAETCATLPGLRFAGLLTHPTPSDGTFLAAARAGIEQRGLRVERVSGGGTPGALSTHTHPELTELRVGTYVYGDRRCIADGTVAVEDCALRVRTTVVSRPTPSRAILDAGSKTLTSDSARPSLPGFGLILEYPEAEIVLLSEEHGHVDLRASARDPAVGDVVTVIPNHACAVSNLHDTVTVRRDDGRAQTWSIAARGKVR